LNLLLIEDDSNIIDTVRLALKLCWPKARLFSASRGRQGIDLAGAKNLDIVLLDLGLPDMSGFNVIKEIRSFSAVPIMIITVMSDEKDIVKGLELGADEYVVKPFGQMELLARIQALLRRQDSQHKEPPVSTGNIYFSLTMGNLVIGDRNIKLSRTEGLIIYELIKNAGHVVTYNQLAEVIWGSTNSEAINSIRVYICSLRDKVELNPHKPQIVLNQAGVGYYLNVKCDSRDFI